MEEKKFCQKCGAEILKDAEICPQCGCRQADANSVNGVNTRWLTTLLLCIFIGAFGAHRFYVGKTNTAVAMLLVSLLLGWTGVGFLVTGIWALVDLVQIICGNFTDANNQKIAMK